ncbi:cytochrome P450 [Kineosporia babensis]|uniref:Cytochrome P450 n=1 Tax=Kineosporia babensis TaxID=499548 RepID=A0A9X1NII9_9ACTN|nr:cytochrome P450 [Kineosporia babensis]MCD5314459.1 cytochrome P450 [Kineosporia babensis]
MPSNSPHRAEASAESGCPVHGTLEWPFVPDSALVPPAEWTQLRAECPVASIHSDLYDDSLLITRYEDVSALLSDGRFWRKAAPGESGVRGAQLESLASDEGHMRWRRLLSRLFTAKRMQALRPRITELTNELVDDMIAGGSPADLRKSLGFPVPVYVICELLGVPHEHRAQFSSWSDYFLSVSKYTPQQVTAAMTEMVEYMREHVRIKRADPGDDLISQLITVVDAQDGRMSEAEMVQTAQTLLIAGHESTSNMIGKIVARLLADHRRWEQLVADPSLVPNAIEEGLRMDTTLTVGLHRHVTQETELAGTTVKPDTTVVISTSAANRDEQAFERPEEMDLNRNPNPHLTFSVGPRSCLGQSLARVELQTVVSVLLERLPTLALAVPPEDLELRKGLMVGGLEAVPVRW